MSCKCQKEKILATIDCPKALQATLRGDQENPEVETEAHGKGLFNLSKDHRGLKYHLEVTKLSSELTAAHFHQGAVGVNGQIVRPIEFTKKGDFWIAKGVWKSKDKQNPLNSRAVAMLLTGEMYVNIHTETHPSGEIRGQLFCCADDDYQPPKKKKCPICCLTERGDLFGGF